MSCSKKGTVKAEKKKQRIRRKKTMMKTEEGKGKDGDEDE